ncbi:MAG: general stress protein CsbD [Rhodothermales bacterium]
MATPRMDESWNRIKTQIRAIFGDALTDTELDKGRRDLNKLVDIIHDVTGEPPASIRGRMNAII